MHSSEALPAAPATGPSLLMRLGNLIMRARSTSPVGAKLLPSTSQQVVSQPQLRSDEDEAAALDEELASHVTALCCHMEPLCIEVSLSAECRECSAPLYERQRRALLLERWTMRTIAYKGKDGPAMINSQWLLNAVRSQLHFSQLSAWLARLQTSPKPRRKLSREQCNYKKIEANCDEETERKLNIVYSIKTPGKLAEFAKPPTDHTFPVTDVGNNTYLRVDLQSLPRLDDIPTIKCQCQTQKRRTSKDNATDELVGKLNDLTIGSRKYDGAINSNIGTASRRLSIISNPGSTEYLYKAKEKDVVDDRMLTPCSENGKHKCSCDDESDGNKEINSKQTPKKLDERRLKEIAKYKRRIRKEKMKKLCDSTSSEGEGLKSKETTSIPILQASRFDRLRAIGCYRNQTYLTLPASRIETKSPFVDADSISPPEFKKTNTVGTQTDEFLCQCGNTLDLKCESCHRGMVRSDGNYDLASLTGVEDKQEIGARRKFNDVEDEKSLKKHKCDNSIMCDNVNSNINGLIKRPKLRRVFPIVDRLDRIVVDRHKKDTEKDIQDLHLNTDDSVFSTPKESKRQKTFSIGDDDYVFYEKCDYGTIDRTDADSPKDECPDFKFAEPQQDLDNFESKDDLESLKDGFIFPDPKKGHDSVPSPRATVQFRWRFSSAASMVFHSQTGLPLTSSPAPLRRGRRCFDFDESIAGPRAVNSALFHPISPLSAGPPSPASPACPASPARRTPPPPKTKLRMPPSTSLLGSFEESALQGRLEAVATVHGFTAELGASGAFCPPHKRLPVTVFFYAPGGTNAPYMGHINLGSQGYRVARSGTIQVSLFNPHGTLVKMFVVLYELGGMPAGARTFLRQRTLYMPAGAEPPATAHHKWLRYLIHLRFMTSKSGKLYLHTDIRLIVSRKADLDTATAHSTLFRPIPTKPDQEKPETDKPSRAPNRVFGGSSEFDSERPEMRELGYENQNGVSYELRSFTYAPENPRYSPR